MTIIYLDGKSEMLNLKVTYPCKTLPSKHKCENFPVYCTLCNCVLCSRYILMLAVLPVAPTRTLNTLFRKFHFRVSVNHFMRNFTYFFQVWWEFCGKRRKECELQSWHFHNKKQMEGFHFTFPNFGTSTVNVCLPTYKILNDGEQNGTDF